MSKQAGSNGDPEFAEKLRLLKGDETVAAFARRTGVTYSVMSAYLEGQSSPTLRNLRSIASALNVSPAYLMGEKVARLNKSFGVMGEALRASKAMADKYKPIAEAAERMGRLNKAMQFTKLPTLPAPWDRSGEAAQLPAIHLAEKLAIATAEVADGGRVLEIEGSRYAIIPRFDVEASAGHGSFSVEHPDVQPVLLGENWLRDHLHLNIASLFFLSASGDSMEDTIKHRDLILADRAQVVQPVDGIFVLTLDGQLKVKRVVFGRKGKLKLVSDNKRYEDEETTQDDPGLRLLGRVVWSGGLV